MTETRNMKEDRHMAKKKKSAPVQLRSGKLATNMHVMTVTREMIFNATKPQYNGHACGHGMHGDTSYNRRKEKRDFLHELRADW